MTEEVKELSVCAKNIEDIIKNCSYENMIKEQYTKAINGIFENINKIINKGKKCVLSECEKNLLIIATTNCGDKSEDRKKMVLLCIKAVKIIGDIDETLLSLCALSLGIIAINYPIPHIDNEKEIALPCIEAIEAIVGKITQNKENNTKILFQCLESIRSIVEHYQTEDNNEKEIILSQCFNVVKVILEKITQNKEDEVEILSNGYNIEYFIKYFKTDYKGEDKQEILSKCNKLLEILNKEKQVFKFNPQSEEIKNSSSFNPQSEENSVENKIKNEITKLSQNKSKNILERDNNM